jgi:hypothetical protein
MTAPTRRTISASSVNAVALTTVTRDVARGGGLVMKIQAMDRGTSMTQEIDEAVDRYLAEARQEQLEEARPGARAMAGGTTCAAVPLARASTPRCPRTSSARA